MDRVLYNYYTDENDLTGACMELEFKGIKYDVEDIRIDGSITGYKLFIYKRAY